ncbi:hypothetical protein Ddc_00180 [Ditylenchus destructor]|nr:hypothetical protein Ddc_00180 [Ditylenchus destructor]
MEPLPLKLRVGYKELDSYRRTIFDIVCSLYPNDFHVFQLGSSQATLPSGFLRKSAINSGKQKNHVEKFLIPDAVSSITSAQLNDLDSISSGHENGDINKTDATLAQQTSIQHTQTDSAIAITKADTRSQTPLNTAEPITHSSSIQKTESPEDPAHGESKTALQKISKESISNKISEVKAAEIPKEESKDIDLKDAHRNNVESNQLENETLKKYLKNSTLFRKFESEAQIVISAMNAMKLVKQSPYPGGLLARTISFLMEKNEKVVSSLGVKCEEVWQSSENIRIKSRYRWSEVCMHLWKIGFFERTQDKHIGSINKLELFHIEVILTPTAAQWYSELHNVTMGDLNLRKCETKSIAIRENASSSRQISIKETRTEAANNSKRGLSGLLDLNISDTQNQQTVPNITKQKRIPQKQNFFRIYRNSSMRPSKDRKGDAKEPIK